MALARLKLIIAAFACATCASGAYANDAAPVMATIDRLIKSPDKYANKIVRIEGQVDNCEYDSCNLCVVNATEATENLDTCIGIKFEGYTDDAAGLRTSHAMEGVFRFATVILDAKFDPTCIANYQPPEIAKKAEIICLDRVTVLYNARVEKVLSRKSALNGIVNFYDYGKLTVPSDNDRKAILAELARWYDPKTLDTFVVFMTPHEPYSPAEGAGGLACVCVKQSCDGQWPTRWFAGFNSAANPFACSRLREFKDGWRVVPGDF